MWRSCAFTDPFLFGTTEKLVEATRDLRTFPSVVILRLRNMTALDATGLHALETFADRLHKSGRTLLLCGAREQPAELLAGSEFVDQVGGENILPNIDSALTRARDIAAAFSGIGSEIAADMGRMAL
jgi:sulfate permease, SulP family